jgi:hypothetical protein
VLTPFEIVKSRLQSFLVVKEEHSLAARKSKRKCKKNRRVRIN